MYDDKRITYSQMVVTAHKTELENEEGKVGNVRAKSTTIDSSDEPISCSNKAISIVNVCHEWT